ncbi:MAG: 3-deoxy-D-manno-octulosonate 8-phosphate phosphatase, partial [Candidatus Marinimicrobia bacterium]|nr:3-deoxy-D-manno-octulosonate 8-phosphate phosphatase [Candidatus Neomarinimicrobiota bacterium]
MTKKINKVKMVISDVDGVWTDGAIYKGGNGLEL